MTDLFRARASALASSITGVVVLISICAGCSGSGQDRSAAALCKTFQSQALALHEKYATADAQVKSPSTSSYLRGLFALFQSPSDMIELFAKLDAVAPSDIEPRIASVETALKQELSAGGQTLSDPLSALGSGLATAMSSEGDFEAVNAYINQHCDLSFERSN